MTKEKLEKFLGKKVRVTFYHQTEELEDTCEGILCTVDIPNMTGEKWLGKGYHLIEKPRYYMPFKKSHVKKIEEI